MELTSKGYLKSPDAMKRMTSKEAAKVHQEACIKTPCYSVTLKKEPSCPFCPHRNKI